MDTGYERLAMQSFGLDGFDIGPDAAILAVGAESKAAVGLVADGRAYLSAPLGSLATPAAYRRFEALLGQAARRLPGPPQAVAHDLHPTYFSTQIAHRLGYPLVGVQHHFAHLAALMVDHAEPGPIVGLACDGMGYGMDGAIWGCEVLHFNGRRFQRAGHLEYFPLVGGDAAARQPWRPAAALVQAVTGRGWKAMPFFRRVSADRLNVFERQDQAGINTLACSSLGRVFDAMAFLLDLCAENGHEGQAAMALESAAQRDTVEPYGYRIDIESGVLILSILPMVADVMNDMEHGRSCGEIAARIHETLARLMSDAVTRICIQRKVTTAGLTGGCFNNKRLCARTRDLLRERGLRVLLHQRTVCGDAATPLGQSLVAALRLSAIPPSLRARGREVAPCV